MANQTFNTELARRFIERLLAALRESRANRVQLQEKLFASKSKTLNYLRYLHGDTGQKKRIYICGFDELPTGGRLPIYAVGNLTDAVPRGPLTMSERWERIKDDPKRHQHHKQRAIKYARKKGVPPLKRRVASPFAALGL